MCRRFRKHRRKLADHRIHASAKTAGIHGSGVAVLTPDRWENGKLITTYRSRKMSKELLTYYNKRSLMSQTFPVVRAFLFDLDGTLIDSKLDLVTSVNAMLRQLGRAELPTEHRRDLHRSRRATTDRQRPWPRGHGRATPHRTLPLSRPLSTAQTGCHAAISRRRRSPRCACRVSHVGPDQQAHEHER